MRWRPSTPLPQLVAAIRRVARVVPGAAGQIAELCAHVAACPETGIITGAPGGPGSWLPAQVLVWHKVLRTACRYPAIEIQAVQRTICAAGRLFPATPSRPSREPGPTAMRANVGQRRRNGATYQPARMNPGVRKS
jgi:hypothetical protein